MTPIKRIVDWMAQEPKSRKDGLLRLLILAAGLFFGVLPLVVVVFWHVFLAPWLYLILTSLCFVLSCAFVISGLCLPKTRTRSWEIARYLISPFCCFWVFSFMMLPACFVYAKCGLRMTSSRVQFPTKSAVAIALNSEGHIYCLSTVYCRVQVYDSDGSFLKGWSVPVGGKGSGLEGLFLDENDHMNLVYPGKTCIYADNKLLETRYHPAIPLEDWENYEKKIVYDDSGVFYKSVGKSFSRWQLVKGEGGEESVLTSEPLGLWLVGGPFPAFPLTALSILFWGLLSGMRKRQKRLEG